MESYIFIFPNLIWQWNWPLSPRFLFNKWLSPTENTLWVQGTSPHMENFTMKFAQEGHKVGMTLGSRAGTCHVLDGGLLKSVPWVCPGRERSGMWVWGEKGQRWHLETKAQGKKDELAVSHGSYVPSLLCPFSRGTVSLLNMGNL